MYASDDTIVAVSSPPGRSLRGLVRWSGPGSIDAVNRLLIEPINSTSSLQPVWLRSLGVPALACIFRGPRSYTGQDTAELQVPGHPALLERVLRETTRDAALCVRLAEPGEFTLRAFLNDKLDLTRAEGVAATVSAASAAQLKAAERLRQGKLAERAEAWVDELAASLALVEAGIDFTDQEDVVPIAPADLAEALCRLLEQIELLRRNHRAWSEVEHLPRAVLVGPPSVGKSTLVNLLLGRDRAVIDAQPGTTRDVLETPLAITRQGRSTELLLVDIAGLDTPRSRLDEQAQRAADRAIERADLLVVVTDGVSQSTRTVPEHAATLRVRTHADTRPLRASEPHYDAVTRLDQPSSIDALKPLLAARLAASHDDAPPDALYLQPRHEAAIGAAAEALHEAADLLAGHESDHALPHPEFIAAAMRAGLDALASLGGEVTPDDVIGLVFATFCVGK